MKKTKFNSKVLLFVVVLLTVACIFNLSVVNATDVDEPDTTVTNEPTTEELDDETNEETPTTDAGTEVPTTDDQPETPVTGDGTGVQPTDNQPETPVAGDGTEAPTTGDGTETPSASDESETTIDMTNPVEILKLIPDTISLNASEIQVYDEGGGIIGTDWMLEQQIKTILKDNNIDLDSLGIMFWSNIIGNTINGNLRKCTITFVEKETYKYIAEKEINIKYKNSDNYNSADEQYVENKLKEIDFNLFIAEEIGENFSNNVFEQVEQHVKKLINDDSLTVFVFSNAGCGGDFIVEEYKIYVFKNDVLYATKNMELVVASKITIPDEIPDTDEAYINYALPQIKEWWNYFTVTGVSKIEGEILTEYDYFDIDIINDGTFYKISLDEDDWARVILKKANKTKIMNDVTIGDEAGVIVSGTKIDKTETVYTEMVNEAKAEGYRYVVDAYELHIVSGEIANGLKISFDLGTANNKNEAIVIHKKSDGTYEKFVRTVENGTIEITVDELSPFMVALKYRNRKLDPEPNTGVENYTIVASAIATISLVGLAIIKFKK